MISLVQTYMCYSLLTFYINSLKARSRTTSLTGSKGIHIYKWYKNGLAQVVLDDIDHR